MHDGGDDEILVLSGELRRFIVDGFHSYLRLWPVYSGHLPMP